jgi:ATP-dependent Clp protease ATP-binding subunit ClpA
VYPFERFTETSKRVLTLAQEEAVSSRHSYIGTEHILLGLLRVPESVAGVVLDRLNVDLVAVRGMIATVLGANERIVIQQIIPTSRVKKIIELSFVEARRMSDNFVGTEHLLLGILIEGEGIAAHVLQDLGANLENVTAEIDAVRKGGTIVETESTAFGTSPHDPSSRYTATHTPTGLHLVLFDRAGEGADGSEPLYVNPLDVVRLDAVDEGTTSITLRHDAASTVAVKGSVHEVARRLTES